LRPRIMLAAGWLVNPTQKRVAASLGLSPAAALHQT
jgi:hypothetical protein